MRAVVANGTGGPEVLTIGELPDPAPAEGELLIDVAAAGVNRPDVAQRQGNYPPPSGASSVLGLECSGRVAGLGPGVDESAVGFSVGDQVCALLAGGGYAERVAVPAGQVLHKPAGVDLVSAAGLPETVCTVWSNLFMLAGLRPDEVLLVHGGASGIGTTAIQLGAALGARVFATVGNERKAERCRELGAEQAIVYLTEDFVSVVHDGTDGHGADVVLDVVGAAYLARNLDVLATAGRLVVIGLQQGRRAELDLGTLMRKRAAVLATRLRPRPVSEKTAIVASVGEHVWPLVEDGRFRPVIDRVLPLAEASEAHRVMEASEHIGKLLLSVTE